MLKVMTPNNLEMFHSYASRHLGKFHLWQFQLNGFDILNDAVEFVTLSAYFMTFLFF